MAYEIHTMLTISTGHVSLETAKYLDEGEFGAFNRKYGWVVPIVEGRDGLPEDLAACLAFASKLGATFVMFDSDGDKLDELPEFEW